MQPSETDKLLNYSAFRHCSDPRDKVYGILGIADPNFALMIRPQYSRPKAQVYQDAVVAYIQLYRKLNLLTQCSIHGWEEYLPTWIPNWTKLIERISLGGSHDASGMSSACCNFRSPDTLEVTGVVCATITEVKTPPGRSFAKYVEQSGLKSESKAAEESVYITGERMTHAIISTVTTNRTAERFPSNYSFPSLNSFERIFQQKLSHFRPRFDFGNIQNTYLQEMLRILLGRVMFRTSEGHLGLGHTGTRTGQ